MAAFTVVFERCHQKASSASLNHLAYKDKNTVYSTNKQQWSNATKLSHKNLSCDRSGLDRFCLAPNFKGGCKHDILSWSPDLAKLNPECHLNYS